MKQTRARITAPTSRASAGGRSSPRSRLGLILATDCSAADTTERGTNCKEGADLRRVGDACAWFRRRLVILALTVPSFISFAVWFGGCEASNLDSLCYSQLGAAAPGVTTCFFGCRLDRLVVDGLQSGCAPAYAS